MTEWIDPAIRSLEGSLVILYCVSEGSDYRVISAHDNEKTKKMYEEAKVNGYLKIKTGDFDPPELPIAYIALYKMEENWDLVLEKMNIDMYSETLRRHLGDIDGG